MTQGIRTKNLARGNITIDDSLRSYRYLGKYLIPSQIGQSVSIQFTCAGFPQIYHDVPYAITAQDDYTSTFSRMFSRTGISLARLDNLGGSTWRATFTVNNFNGPFYPWYMRVFGRLDLNPPPSRPTGLRVRNLNGELIFDSNCRPLRLAGDTYDVEMALQYMVPQEAGTTTDIAQYDTAVNLPFNMAGKSICATARGLIYWLYYRGSYVDDGQLVYQYDVANFQTLYWANGSTLYARRVAIDVSTAEFASPPALDLSRCQIVYSRLSVIDNSLFP